MLMVIELGELAGTEALVAQLIVLLVTVPASVAGGSFVLIARLNSPATISSTLRLEAVGDATTATLTAALEALPLLVMVCVELRALPATLVELLEETCMAAVGTVVVLFGEDELPPPPPQLETNKTILRGISLKLNFLAIIISLKLAPIVEFKSIAPAGSHPISKITETK